MVKAKRRGELPARVEVVAGAVDGDAPMRPPSVARSAPG